MTFPIGRIFFSQYVPLPEAVIHVRTAAELASNDLLKALEALVRINEEHNDAMAKIIGRPVGWKDSYLDEARAAIRKAKGGQA